MNNYQSPDLSALNGKSYCPSDEQISNKDSDNCPGLSPGYLSAAHMSSNVHVKRELQFEKKECFENKTRQAALDASVATVLDKFKNIATSSACKPAPETKKSAEKWAAMSRNTIPYEQYLRFPYISKYLDIVMKYRKKGPTLETGIGSGHCSIYMSRNGAHAEGFDNSHDVVLTAQEFNLRYVGNAFFFLGDLFKEESYSRMTYDVIFHQGVLEHFSDTDIRKILLLQVHHADHVVFSVPSQYFPRKVFGDERLLSKEKWEEILTGFTIDELFYYGDPAYRCNEQEHLLSVIRT